MTGFSIDPPKEKGWIIAKQTPELAIIGKQGRFAGETFTVQATLIMLPRAASADELVRHVESTQRKELDPKRFRVYKFEVSRQEIGGQGCAFSRVDAAERTTAEGTGSPVNVMVETATLICPHPKDPLRGINLAYSHRHFPEDVDPRFSQDAAALLQSLAFEPL